MMDWNGDGRINSMDTYDMMHDTSAGRKGSRRSTGNGGNAISVFLKQFLIVGVICLILSLIEPALAKVLILGFGVCKVALG